MSWDVGETIFRVFHYFFGAVGCFLNILLIFLALTKTPKGLKAYSMLILNFAFTDLTMCLCDVVVQQRLIPAGLGLVFISNGPCTYIGPQLCFQVHNVMLHMMTHFIWSLLFSFAYRFYVLLHPAPQRRTIICLLLLIYTPSFLQLIAWGNSADPPSTMERVVVSQFPEYNISGKTVTGADSMFRPLTIYVLLHVILPVTPIYVSILVLRRKIIRKLSIVTHVMRQTTKDMHRQLLKSLTIQACLPGFLWVAVLLYCIGQWGLFNHPILEYAPFSLNLLIPVLSPITSLSFIRPYRKQIKGVFQNRAAISNVNSESSRNEFTVSRKI